jgi:hypothetical protein
MRVKEIRSVDMKNPSLRDPSHTSEGCHGSEGYGSSMNRRPDEEEDDYTPFFEDRRDSKML